MITAKRYISVIGGINIDLKGIPDTEIHMYNSNPGFLHSSPGGVARNIAENLAKLDIPVYLFGSVGIDAFGDQILEIADKSGINIDFVKKIKAGRTGSYLSILNNKKEMLLSISDMKISGEISTDYIKSNKEIISGSCYIAADTNIPKESLQLLISIAEKNKIPILIDPVSIQKSMVLKQLTGKITYVTPNLAEYNALTEINPKILDKKKDNEEFQNISKFIVTMGDRGVYCFNNRGENLYCIPSPKIEIVDSNGAGDAFTAGFLYGLYNGMSEKKSIEYGISAAGITLNSADTVSDKMDKNLLLRV